ncbi:MAG: FAD-dependent monooxygenase [Pseudomonadota bacterium]|nr:FAD-dependent monooxygenase [Pseudomonadota bacterium]
MHKKFDFVIVGGGLVGCLASLILSKKNYTVCLVEKKIFKHIISDNFTPLSLTINTIQFLNKHNLWDSSYVKANEITELTVKLFNSFNIVRFSSDDLYGEELGSVVDKSSFLSYLIDHCKKSKNINIVDEVDVHIKSITSPIELSQTQSRATITGDYLIVTDGANSQLAKNLDMDSFSFDYGQTSYMFNANYQHLSKGAFQIFSKKGIFAILPCNDASVSIVASIYNEFIDYFAFESENANFDLLEMELVPYLKGIDKLKLIYKYPLNTIRLTAWSKQNVIFLGNSSQLIHPFGAQGFNFAADCIQVISDKSEDLLLDSSFNPDILDIIDKKRNALLNRIDFTSSALMRNSMLANLYSSVFSRTINLSSTLRKSFLKKIVGLN